MRKLSEKLKSYKFAVMVFIAIIVTTVLSSASVLIYVWTGAINIDLSRPGYEKNREETAYSNDETPFSSSGPINNEVIEDFNQRLTKLQNELGNMNDFSDDDTNDEALGL